MRFTNHLRCLIRITQKVIKNEQNIVNVDRIRLNVRAGAGGVGIARYNGVGGNGGSVFLIGRPEQAFADIPQHLGNRYVAKAESGAASATTKLVGQHGNDLILPVPIGVEAVDDERNVLIGRCTRANQRVLIARGGEGGYAGNGYKSQKGDQLTVTLHLKLRPNIGLVGFPNAGKSTLLQAFVPRKSVKIAPYPFTTVKPQIGFWNPTQADSEVPTESPFTLSIADLPGIIEGASQNRGKGLQFLKHLEYCDVLLMVVDVNGFQLANKLDEPFRTPLETVALLNLELENYHRRLTTKPTVLVLNKLDIAKDVEEVQRLSDRFKNDNWWEDLPPEFLPKCPLHFDYVIPMSARNGEIEEVKNALTRLYRNLQPRFVPSDLVPKDGKFLV